MTQDRSALSPAPAGEGRGEGFRRCIAVTWLLLLLLATPSQAAAEVTYPPVLPGKVLSFPLDEGSHPDYRIEWWYVTGQIEDSTSKVKAPRGFQVTFFRVRTGLAEQNPSSFAPRQVLFAHAAIADIEGSKLHHAQRAARSGFDLAYASEGRVDVRLDDWTIREVQPGQYVTVVHGEDFDFELTLRSTQPPMLQGERGFSRKGPDPRAASHYYSLPQLQVSGEVTLNGKRQPVTGKAWFDHEWSSDYVDAEALGWDWMGVNLHDGGALMAFRMRDRAGGERWASATHRGSGDTTSSPQAAPDQKSYGPEQVQWTPLRTWRSPRTGVTYPVAWRVEVGDRRYRVDPLLLDAELDSRPTTGILYWEGPVRLIDETTGKEAGRGYLELTGYGGKLDL